MKTSNVLLCGFFGLLTVILFASFWTLKEKVDHNQYTLEAANELSPSGKDNTFTDFKALKIKGIKELELKRDASLYYADHLKKYVLALAAKTIETEMIDDTLLIVYQEGAVSQRKPSVVYLTHIDHIMAQDISLYYLPPLEKECDPTIHLALKDSYFNTGFSSYWYSRIAVEKPVRAQGINYEIGDLILEAQSSDIDFSLTGFSKLKLNLDDQSSLKILGGFSVDELQGKISGDASTKYELPETEKIFKPITERKTEKNDTP